MSVEIPTVLILEAEEDIEVLDTTPGWNSQEEWVPFTVPTGRYQAERAINPFSPDGTWFFIKGTKFGQRESWLNKVEKAGIKVKLFEVKPLEEVTSNVANQD